MNEGFDLIESNIRMNVSYEYDAIPVVRGCHPNG